MSCTILHASISVSLAPPTSVAVTARCKVVRPRDDIAPLESHSPQTQQRHTDACCLSSNLSSARSRESRMASAAPPVPARRNSPAPYAAPPPQAAPPPPLQTRPTAPPPIDDGVLRVRALFDFPGTADGDLVFRKGDVIIVTQKLAPGWWEGAVPRDILALYIEAPPSACCFLASPGLA